MLGSPHTSFFIQNRNFGFSKFGFVFIVFYRTRYKTTRKTKIWKTKISMQAIVLRLMDIIVLNQAGSSEDATTAFLLLPGIIHVNQLYKSKKSPTFQLLTRLAKYVDTDQDHQIFANKIILEARKLAPFVVAFRQRHADRRQDPISLQSRKEKAIQRIQRLHGERRLSTAMLSVEELQGFIDADSVTETHAISYFVQDVRTTLADLCPAADAQDEFDADARQAIAESAPQEIPLDRVQFILEKLPDSAAAGASG